MMALALPAPMVVAAVSDDGPESESEPERDLNSSPISPRPSSPIAVDEQPEDTLGRIIAEQAGSITFYQERVKALDLQIKTRDEQISSLVSRNALVCAQKQTLQVKVARANREVKKEQEEVKQAEQNDRDLRRMIEVKNREITKHSHHLRTIVDEHADRLANYGRRTALAEAKLAKMEAAWPVGTPMPEVSGFVRYH